MARISYYENTITGRAQRDPAGFILIGHSFLARTGRRLISAHQFVMQMEINIMPRILTPKAKRLHVEAQRRYLDRLEKRKAPTTEIMLRAVGRAAIATSVAQIVNIGSGKMVAATIMQSAVHMLCNAGYDKRESVLRLQRLLSDAKLLHTATDAAKDAHEGDPEASTGTYCPNA